MLTAVATAALTAFTAGALWGAHYRRKQHRKAMLKHVYTCSKAPAVRVEMWGVSGDQDNVL